MRKARKGVKMSEKITIRYLETVGDRKRGMLRKVDVGGAVNLCKMGAAVVIEGGTKSAEPPILDLPDPRADENYLIESGKLKSLSDDRAELVRQIDFQERQPIAFRGRKNKTDRATALLESGEIPEGIPRNSLDDLRDKLSVLDEAIKIQEQRCGVVLLKAQGIYNAALEPILDSVTLETATKVLGAMTALADLKLLYKKYVRDSFTGRVGKPGRWGTGDPGPRLLGELNNWLLNLAIHWGFKL